MPKQLKPRGKGAKPPESQTPPAAQKKASKPRKQAKQAPKSDYIRNRWGSDVRITLSETNDERKLVLLPRGQRGDLARISDEEWEDDKMDYTLVERISGEEARQVMDGQLTNQQAPHAALDALRNAHDQPYTTPVTVAIPFEQQGTVVAQVQQGNPTSPHLESSEVLTRPSGAAPQQVAVPGSIQNPVEVPANIPPEQRADWLARQGRGGEAAATNAAEQLRGSLNVRVAPTQREIKPGQ